MFVGRRCSPRLPQNLRGRHGDGSLAISPCADVAGGRAVWSAAWKSRCGGWLDSVGCRDMSIVLDEPGVDGLIGAVDALRAWQEDGAPVQLHPGDLGWAWAMGAQRLAGEVRTWSRGGRIVAVGYLDSPDVLRLTAAPDLRQDADLARQLAADLSDPARGVLPAGKVAVEAPNGAVLREVLAE